MSRPIIEDQPLVEPSAGPTREFSFPFILPSDGLGGEYQYPADTLNYRAWGGFRVPWDFTAWTSIEIVLWPIIAGASNLSVRYYAGACGELYNTHALITNPALVMALNQLLCFDALADGAAFWAALTPGDNVMLSVRNVGASQARIPFGIVRYT